jgi:hypothetical protein
VGPRRSPAFGAELAEEAAVVGAHELLGQQPVVIELEDTDQVHDNCGAVGRKRPAGDWVNSRERPARGTARASYAPAERILAAAIADDLHAEPDALAPRLAAITAVTGLRELYDTREARSLGPQPSGADLIQLVNQVIDYAIAGLAAVVGCAL